MSKRRPSPRKGSPRRRNIAPLVFLGALLILLAVGVAVYFGKKQQTAAQQDRLTSYVMDQAGIVDAAERARLHEKLRDLYQSGGPQVVVATAVNLEHATIAEDAIEHARRWRIGRAGRNDGVLLYIVANAKKARIEVGYGLEGVLTDAASRIVIDRRIEPHLRAGEWTAAARDGVEGILEILATAPPAPPPPETPPTVFETWLKFAGIGVAAIVGVVAALAILAGIVLVLRIIVLSFADTLQAGLLLIPGMKARLEHSPRWSWLAERRWKHIADAQSSGDRDSGSSSSYGSGSSSSSSSDSGGGGDFGGGGSND